MNESHKSNDEFEKLRVYLAAAITSSIRHRRIVVIAVTASILILGTSWNSFHFGWTNSRVRMHESAATVLTLSLQIETLQNLDFAIRNHDEFAANYWKQKSGFAFVDGKNQTESEKIRLINAEINRLNEIVNLEMSTCAAFLDLKTADLFSGARFWNVSGNSEKIRLLLDRIEPQKQELQKLRAQSSYLIRLPFFGISFEINDLGFLGGATFTVMLIWFRLSLWNEANNLQFIVLNTSNRFIQFAYHNLAMQQVLTIPPSFWRKEDVRRSHDLVVPLLSAQPSAWVPKILYLLPVTIHFVILAYDLYSVKVGWTISQGMTASGLTLTAVLFAINCYLTRVCFTLANKIDDIWSKFAAKASSVKHQTHRSN
jgi:hypothetical protein